MSHSELTAFLESNPLDCSYYDYCDERCPRFCNGVCLPVGEWLKQEVVTTDNRSVTPHQSRASATVSPVGSVGDKRLPPTSIAPQGEGL